LMPTHQSAYMKFHSIETALLKVQRPAFQAPDRGQFGPVLELT